jgi:YggT family protein
MTSGVRFLWYYHLPDLILAVLIYLLIARLVLAPVWRTHGGMAPLRALGVITGPVLAGVAAITPKVVPLPLVIVFAMLWLLAARLALFIAVTARGIRLTLG